MAQAWRIATMEDDGAISDVLADFKRFSDMLRQQLNASEHIRWEFKSKYLSWILVRENTIQQLDKLKEAMENTRRGEAITQGIGSTAAIIGGLMTLFSAAFESSDGVPENMTPSRQRHNRAVRYSTDFENTHVDPEEWTRSSQRYNTDTRGSATSDSPPVLQQVGTFLSTTGALTQIAATITAGILNTVNKSSAKEVIQEDEKATKALLESFKLATTSRRENLLSVLNEINQYITMKQLLESGLEAAQDISDIVNECIRAVKNNRIDWNMISKLRARLQNAGEKFRRYLPSMFTNRRCPIFAIQSAFQLFSGDTLAGDVFHSPRSNPAYQTMTLGAIAVATNLINLVSACMDEGSDAPEEALRKCKEKLKEEMMLFKAFYEELQ